MECFLNETAADLAASHDDALFSVAVNICGNCGTTAERLTFVPEFDYSGCDDCGEEAQRALAAEGQPEVIPAGTCPTRYAPVSAAETIDEMRLALRSHEAECAQCGSTKKTVVGDRLLVNPAAVCCGEAA
jgi:hypothetical protein